MTVREEKLVKYVHLMSREQALENRNRSAQEQALENSKVKLG